MRRARAGAVLALSLCSAPAWAIDKPNTVYQVFQFPRDAIPRVDGQTDDWAIVPDSYAIGMDQLVDSHLGKPRDPRNLDVKVEVGWVEGQNRLYFLYEAYDDYWDFGRGDLHNDMFEIVVDGDLSGGPLIADMHPDRDRIPRWQLYRAMQGVFAQNWHIFTPAVDKEWAMVWGCQQPWLRALPYANAAYRYDFRPGGKGKLVLEFWITPFDYASCDGSQRSVESNLYENKLIGLSWATKDYDDPKGDKQSFWNLSEKVTMYGNASDLVRFRLMPLEPPLRRPLEARWTFAVIDPDARVVAFRDTSRGVVARRTWDFGDGATSHDPRPVHAYARGGPYIVTLEVEGPAGKSRIAKVWDIVLRE